MIETRLMIDASTSDFRGVALPRIMYGTAWKEDRTKPLVLEAIAAGFRAFDTANQRKAWREEVSVALTPSGAAAAILFARSMAQSSSLPGGVTSWTRPRRYASGAPHSSPVSM